MGGSTQCLFYVLRLTLTLDHYTVFSLTTVQIFPSAAADKLGFTTIRKRLAYYLLSALGEEQLAKMSPSSNLEEVHKALDQVQELQDAFTFDDPIPFNHVYDVRGAINKAMPEEAFLEPVALKQVRLVLTTVRRLFNYFDRRREKYPTLERVTRAMTPLEDIEKAITSVIDEDQERVLDSASPELRRLRRAIIRKQDDLRATLNDALRRAVKNGYATESRPTIRSGRMVIPIHAKAKRNVEGFIHDTSSTGQTVFIEPSSCLELNNEVRELETEEQREVERILREVTGRLRRQAATIRENLRVLGRLDLLQAKARLAKALDASVPTVTDEGVLRIEKARNPVLQLRFEGQKAAGETGEDEQVVPLDLELGDSFKTLVVTGPNAGGKTVSMKTTGLLVWMVACGLPVPVDAEASHISLFDHLFLDIGDEQSIEKDLSTFSSHLSNMRFMVRHATNRSLILIDEAGTGTDPAEGGALAQAILEHLTRVGARTIATTHHGTLKVYAHEAKGVENGSMEFDQATLKPTYRFQIGVPGSSYAFEVAERLGLSTDVLARARELVGGEKRNLEDLITTLEARTQELQTQLQEAQKETRQSMQKRKEYEAKVEKLRGEGDEIRAQALEEAERIVNEANARIERTIREIKEAEAEREATKKIREKLGHFQETVSKKRTETAQNEPRETAPEEEKARTKPSGPVLQVGDQVVLDGGSTKAEVVEMEGDDVVIAMGNMRIETSRDRLERVGGPREQQVTVSHGGGGGGSIAALKAQKRIDLRGQRVQEALVEVERFLDNAVAANVSSVDILHGKGTGALRKAIHGFLRDYPNVTSFDVAPYEEGGAGVTVVELQ